MPRLHLRERATSLLTSIVIGYLLVLAILRIFESRLIFFPDYPNRLAGDWHPRGLPVEDVWLASSDGTKLHAWWIPNEKAQFTFVAFHGNASNVANRASVYEFLRVFQRTFLRWNTAAMAKAKENQARPAFIVTPTPRMRIS